MLAKAGHRVLLLEHHYQFGGLATWFTRKGGHIFDISLHGFPIGMIKSCRKYWTKEIAEVAFTVLQRDGVRALGLPNISAGVAIHSLRAAAPDEAALRVSNLSRAYRVNLTVLSLVAVALGLALLIVMNGLIAGIMFVLAVVAYLPIAALALVVSALTGVIAGFLPAWRAARMNRFGTRARLRGSPR